MGVPNLEDDYTSAKTGRGDHEVCMDMWWHWGKRNTNYRHVAKEDNIKRDLKSRECILESFWPETNLEANQYNFGFHSKSEAMKHAYEFSRTNKTTEKIRVYKSSNENLSIVEDNSFKTLK
jgi:hypothetical protein